MLTVALAIAPRERKCATAGTGAKDRKELSQLQRIVLAANQLPGPQVQLTADQQHYLARVLRLKVGDRFVALDGQGQGWTAQMVGSTEALLLESVGRSREVPIPITLVAALPKGSGFDEVVRQATELGVSHIQPVLSQRTLLNPSPQKLDRWRKIAQEAAEQSERMQVPSIGAPMTFAEAIAAITASHRYLCAARGDAPSLLAQLTSDRPQAASLCVAVGPEGGWTEAEIEAAIAAGYQPVSLGARILRAVTAPLAAIALIAALWETRASSDAPVSDRSDRDGTFPISSASPP